MSQRHRQIRFTDSATTEVTVKNGDYKRKFERAEQPFKVKEEHWPMLRRTGHFEEVPAGQKALPPATPQADANGAADNK